MWDNTLQELAGSLIFDFNILNDRIKLFILVMQLSECDILSIFRESNGWVMSCTDEKNFSRSAFVLLKPDLPVQ